MPDLPPFSCRQRTNINLKFQVQNLTDSSPIVNAKSILNILTLGVMQNHEIEIIADGDDAAEAIEGFKALINDNFGE